MSETNGSVPVEAEEAPDRRALSAAIRFNGKPYIIFLNGDSWDCEPVPKEDVRRFEQLERRWEAEKTMRIAKVRNEGC